MAGKLTDKQRRFVDEYLVDLNATQAYLRAGYRSTPASARVQACRLLADPNVGAAIEAAKKARSERTQITADRVLQELARLAFVDVRRLYREDGSMKAPHELDDDTAAALASVEVTEELGPSGEGDGGRELVGFTKKAKLYDKGAAIALAMRHLGMLKDKVEHSGEIGLRGLADRMRRRAQA